MKELGMIQSVFRPRFFLFSLLFLVISALYFIFPAPYVKAASSMPFDVTLTTYTNDDCVSIASVHKTDVVQGDEEWTTWPETTVLTLSVITSDGIYHDVFQDNGDDANPGRSFSATIPADGELTACIESVYDIIASNHITGVIISNGQALVVDAGPDQQGNTSNAVTLHGSVIDNRPAPSNKLTITWKKISGPGSVTFADTAMPLTTAVFSQPGKYVLQLSANDSQSSATSTVNVSIIDHYLVELKAWIPQASVVDPALIAPFNFSNSSIPKLGDPLRSCFAQAANNKIKGNTHVFASSFLTDNHTSYGHFPSVNPDYRVLNSVQFDFDGTQVLHFTPSPIFIPAGTSTRSVVIEKAKGGQTICSQSATTTPQLAQNQVDATSFTMSIKGSDPLTPKVGTPFADGKITGHLEASGDISFNYGTDFFPNYGIAVQRNTHVWMEDIINDVSCVSTQGYLGAAQIAVRLMTIGSPERNIGIATRSSGNVPCVKQYYPELVNNAEKAIELTVNKHTEWWFLEEVSHQ